MARNGTEFGVRVSGTGDRWFTAPSPHIDGLYFPGFGPEDANPDLGDSAITETGGLGAFALAAAPAITQFVGGTPALAQYTEEMYAITLWEHPRFSIPSLDFRGTPIGMDVKVAGAGSRRYSTRVSHIAMQESARSGRASSACPSNHSMRRWSAWRAAHDAVIWNGGLGLEAIRADMPSRVNESPSGRNWTIRRHDRCRR